MQLRTAGEGRQIVGHYRRRVMHALTYLRHGLALQSETNDLHPMREHRTDILHGAAKRNGRIWIGTSQGGQIARDRARADEQDAIRQVFAREQSSLAECLLTQIRNASAPKRLWSRPVKQPIIFGAAMDEKADRALAALSQRLAGRLVCIDRDHAHRSWWSGCRLNAHERS